MTSVTNQQESDTTAIVSVMNKDRKKKRLITKKKQPQQLRKEEDDYILYLYENEQKLQNTLYNNSVECPICFLVRKTAVFFLLFLLTQHHYLSIYLSIILPI
jgi:hypothetical protein